MQSLLINLAYMVAAFGFIFGIKLMSHPETARKGNTISAVGMLIAVIATLLESHVVTYSGILVGLIIGGSIGALVARRVAMTAMPEMVALLHGFGGSASLLVGVIAYLLDPHMGLVMAISTFVAIGVGGLTFAGSIIAWAKLRDFGIGRPITFTGQHIVNAAIVLGLLGTGAAFACPHFQTIGIVMAMVGLSLAIGIMAVLPIGGADMPVVISLLNAYSGVAVCAAGFVINNNLLIVAGALIGANGTILTRVMCKAMNRSLQHVLFAGFGQKKQSKGEAAGKERAISVADAYAVLEAASSVVIVPGYGLAVAQAQHAVRELGELLEKNGAEVRYAIHPVAGRMPGHMNVLLAEANVPYDQLVEMDEINPILGSVDVAIVIGANDTVNPAARDDESSPIYGMPIINVDQAKTVFVLKRSMASGFAGIGNPLFYMENTAMIFGDAKATANALVAEFKE